VGRRKVLWDMGNSSKRLRASEGRGAEICLQEVTAVHVLLQQSTCTVKYHEVKRKEVVDPLIHKPENTRFGGGGGG
jgi:hypothetical protein